MELQANIPNLARQLVTPFSRVILLALALSQSVRMLGVVVSANPPASKGRETQRSVLLVPLLRDRGSCQLIPSGQSHVEYGDDATIANRVHGILALSTPAL